MDNIDATNRDVPSSSGRWHCCRHAELNSDQAVAPPPSLLAVILDTNPLPWSEISFQLSIHSVLSALLVFVNAHLAINHANQVAVFASHTDRIAWLYPTPQSPSNTQSSLANGHGDDQHNSHDRHRANIYP